MANKQHVVRLSAEVGRLIAEVGRPRLARVTTPRRLDGAGEARLIALACSPAPAGRARWSLRLLA